MAFATSYRSTLLSLSLSAGLMVCSISLATAQTTSPAPSATAVKPTGSLQQSHNAWRATRLDGAYVYNEQGSSVGTINDMLLDSTGKVSNVVLSVGGYLGLASKYVEVPFSKLKFEPSKGSPVSNADAPATAAKNQDYSIVLPGVTKESLKTMTAFVC